MTGKASLRGKALQKKRYEDLKLAGICVSCGSRPATDSAIRCTECLAKRAKENKIRRVKVKYNQKTNNRFPANGFADFH